jgi:hypothetical protein
MPTAVWIWDIASKVLKAVMIQHAPVVKVTWHPEIDELLMVRCEGDDCTGLVHFWEPTWDNPKIVDFGAQVPGGKIIGKSIGRWLGGSTSPCVFFSDTQDCMLAVLSDDFEEEILPWQDAIARGLDIYGQREESPLNLVAADEREKTYDHVTVKGLLDDDDTTSGMSAGSEEIDDTFQFKRFVGH